MDNIPEDIITFIITFLHRNDVLNFLSLNKFYANIKYCFTFLELPPENFEYRIVRKSNFSCKDNSDLINYYRDQYSLLNTVLEIDIDLFLLQTNHNYNFNNVILTTESRNKEYIIPKNLVIKNLTINNIKNNRIFINSKKSIECIHLLYVNECEIFIEKVKKLSIAFSKQSHIEILEISKLVLISSDIFLKLNDIKFDLELQISSSENSQIIGLSSNVKIYLQLCSYFKFTEDIKFESLYCLDPVVSMISCFNSKRYIFSRLKLDDAIYLKKVFLNIEIEIIELIINNMFCMVKDVHNFQSFKNSVALSNHFNTIKMNLSQHNSIKNLINYSIYLSNPKENFYVNECNLQDFFINLKSDLVVYDSNIKKCLFNSEFEGKMKFINSFVNHLIIKNCKSLEITNSTINKICLKQTFDSKIFLPNITKKYTLYPSELLLQVESESQLDQIKLNNENNQCKIILKTKPKVIKIINSQFLYVNGVHIDNYAEYHLRKRGEYHLINNQFI